MLPGPGPHFQSHVPDWRWQPPVRCTHSEACGVCIHAAIFIYVKNKFVHTETHINIYIYIYIYVCMVTSIDVFMSVYYIIREAVCIF